MYINMYIYAHILTYIYVEMNIYMDKRLFIYIYVYRNIYIHGQERKHVGLRA